MCRNPACKKDGREGEVIPMGGGNRQKGREERSNKHGNDFRQEKKKNGQEKKKADDFKKREKKRKNEGYGGVSREQNISNRASNHAAKGGKEGRKMSLGRKISQLLIKPGECHTFRSRWKEQRPIRKKRKLVKLKGGRGL